MSQKTIEILLKLNDQMGAQLVKQTENMREAAIAADKLTQAVKQEGNAQQDAAGKTQKNSDSVGSLLGGLAKAAAVYISVTSAVHAYANAARYVAEVGGQFEQSLANTRAILQPTAKEFSALAYSAKELGATTVFTASQAGDAYTELGKLGFNTAQILASGNDILNLAAAANLDMATAATAAATTVRQFGLTAGDTAEVVDVMTKAVSISALEASDFTEAMKYVGPVANKAGIGLAEAAAAVAALSDEGLAASTIGTSLRRIIATLGDSSSLAAKALAKAAPEARTFTEKLAALQKMGLDTTSAVKFFRIEASTAATILASSAGKVRAYGDELAYVEGKAKGYAERVAAIQLDTFQGDLKLAQSAMEDVGITFSQAFGTDARDAVQTVTKELGKLTKWADENPAKLEEWSKAALEAFKMAVNGAELAVKGVSKLNDVLAYFIDAPSATTTSGLFEAATNQMGEYQKQLSITLQRQQEFKQEIYQGNNGSLSVELAKKQLTAAELEERALLRKIEDQKKINEGALVSIENTILQLNTKNVLLDSEKKELDNLIQKLPLMKKAVEMNLSIAAATKLLAKEEAERQTALGKAEKPAERGSGKAADGTGIDVNGMKDAAKAAETANKQFADILRQRELEQYDSDERSLIARRQYWEKVIEEDRKGGGAHLAELSRMYQEEVYAAYQAMQEISVNPNPQVDEGLRGTSGQGGAEQAASKARELNARAQVEAKQLAKEVEARKLSEADQEIAIQQAKYDAEYAQLERFGLDTAELTRQNEAEIAKIKEDAARKEMDTRLAIANQMNSGLLAAAQSFQVKNKALRLGLKASLIAEATANGIVGAVRAFRDLPLPLAIPASIGIAAGTAAQVNNIRKLQFAKGNMSADASFGRVPYIGGGYGSDNVPIMASPGERVLTRKQADEYEARSAARPISITYSPSYSGEMSSVQKRRTRRDDERWIKKVVSDPAFGRMQAAI